MKFRPPPPVNKKNKLVDSNMNKREISLTPIQIKMNLMDPNVNKKRNLMHPHVNKKEIL